VFCHLFEKEKEKIQACEMDNRKKNRVACVTRHSRVIFVLIIGITVISISNRNSVSSRVSFDRHVGLLGSVLLIMQILETKFFP